MGGFKSAITTAVGMGVAKPVTQPAGPTAVEVSNSAAVDAAAAALKAKQQGRSATILTGPEGLAQNLGATSIVRKTLLGG